MKRKTKKYLATFTAVATGAVFFMAMDIIQPYADADWVQQAQFGHVVSVAKTSSAEAADTVGVFLENATTTIADKSQPAVQILSKAADSAGLSGLSTATASTDEGTETSEASSDGVISSTDVATVTTGSNTALSSCKAVIETSVNAPLNVAEAAKEESAKNESNGQSSGTTNQETQTSGSTTSGSSGQSASSDSTAAQDAAAQKAAQEAAAKKAAEEKAAQEAAQKAAQEAAAKKAAEEKAAQEAAAQKAAQEAAAKKAAEEKAAQKAAQEKAAQEAAQKAAQEKAAQEAAQKAAAQKAAQEAAAKAAAQKAAQEAAQKAAAQSTAQKRLHLVAFAKQYVGYPYKWGGTDPTKGGADCSGFVYYVYRHFGYNVPRLGFENKYTRVSFSDLQPGDIIRYDTHYTIYIGNNQEISAENERNGIQIRTLSFRFGRRICACRVIV